MAKAQKITLKATPHKGAGKKDKEVDLLIQGELTIVNSTKLKDFLIDSIGKYNHLNVKVSQAESIDLTAIQLFQRFIWDAQEAKKSVDFTFELSDEDKILIERSGLNSIITSSK